MKYSTDDIAIIVALEEELPETILPEFKIFYSGVGKINATLKTAEVIYKTNPKLVINYGSAGALNKNMSGLVRSKELLGHLKEISIVDFDHSDVVRHPLVSKIVKAYSNND